MNEIQLQFSELSWKDREVKRQEIYGFVAALSPTVAALFVHQLHERLVETDGDEVAVALGQLFETPLTAEQMYDYLETLDEKNVGAFIARVDNIPAKERTPLQADILLQLTNQAVIRT